jgi:hypothetical protein
MPPRGTCRINLQVYDSHQSTKGLQHFLNKEEQWSFLQDGRNLSRTGMKLTFFLFHFTKRMWYGMWLQAWYQLKKEWNIDNPFLGPALYSSKYLVALPITSPFAKSLRIQSRRVPILPSSWHHVSISTTSPLQVKELTVRIKSYQKGKRGANKASMEGWKFTKLGTCRSQCAFGLSPKWVRVFSL